MTTDEPPLVVIAGWEMSVTMQRRTPLKWLQRHREFHEGPNRPQEELPPEHACWVPVTKSWKALGIDLPEIPEGTMASEIGYIPVSGGNFLRFLIEYRILAEEGKGDLGEILSRYPQFRDALCAPPTPKRSQKRTAPRLNISILDYAELPESPDQFHFNFEFHCSECGGYIIHRPDTEEGQVYCTACGAIFGIREQMDKACQAMALDELKSKKLGAFREK